MGNNRLKTMVLLASLTALVLFLGQALGGRGGLLMALIFAGGMNFASYWWSDKIVLRMYNAQEVSESEAPDLYRMIVDLVQTGSTLRANGLVETETIATVTSRLIVNRTALKTQPERIGAWIARFRAALGEPA